MQSLGGRGRAGTPQPPCAGPSAPRVRDSSTATSSGSRACADLASLSVTTYSRQKALPAWQLALLGEDGATKKAKRMLVDEECPKCKHPKMFFYTMQMRSADEGQTVFYECPTCSHTYSVNT